MNTEGPLWLLPPSSPSPSDERGHGRALITLVAAAVLVVAAVAVGLVLLLGSDDDARAEDDPTTGPPASESTDVRKDRPKGKRSEEPRKTPAGAAAAPAEEAADAPGVPDEDPGAVTQRFVDAVKAGDCATANSLVTRQLSIRQGGCESPNLRGLESIEISVGEAEVDGRNATVPVTIAFGGDLPGDDHGHHAPDHEVTYDVSLVARGDHWKIDDFDEEGDVR